MNWQPPITIIGSPATGSYFYDRSIIIDEIWLELEKKNSVLIAAPRRVGKTSVMKRMIEFPRQGYCLVFKNIQSISSSAQFFETIYTLLLQNLTTFAKVKNWFINYLKTKKISEADLKGRVKIDFVGLDYVAEINQVVLKLQEHDETVVLLLDELPEVLYNLHLANKNEEAIDILKNLRVWRQDERFKCLRFVLSGSVGIHFVVQQITGRVSDINDLKEVKYTAFSKEEAKDFIFWATKNATVKYTEPLSIYLIKKISYCVPFFLNLMLEQIDQIAKNKKNPNITNTDIDLAFLTVIKNNSHFEEWKFRLERYMLKADFLFVNEILTHIAHKGFILIQEIYNKAIKYQKEAAYMGYIRDLEKDGYIIKEADQYIFISSFLKEFWKQDNPIYNAK